MFRPRRCSNFVLLCSRAAVKSSPHKAPNINTDLVRIVLVLLSSMKKNSQHLNRKLASLEGVSQKGEFGEWGRRGAHTTASVRSLARTRMLKPPPPPPPLNVHRRKLFVVLVKRKPLKEPRRRRRRRRHRRESVQGRRQPRSFFVRRERALI